MEASFLLFRSRASNSRVVDPFLTEIELDDDFMSDLITCKWEAQIKMAEKSFRHGFSPL